MPLKCYACRGYDDLERIFWRTVQYQAPMYGADAGGHGTLFQKGVPWNLSELKNILNLVYAQSSCCLHNQPNLRKDMCADVVTARHGSVRAFRA